MLQQSSFVSCKKNTSFDYCLFLCKTQYAGKKSNEYKNIIQRDFYQNVEQWYEKENREPALDAGASQMHPSSMLFTACCIFNSHSIILPPLLSLLLSFSFSSSLHHSPCSSTSYPSRWEIVRLGGPLWERNLSLRAALQSGGENKGQSISSPPPHIFRDPACVIGK